MTADQPTPGTEPFLVVASLYGARLQITARSPLAAAAAAQYWRSLGAEAVNWWLRADLTHPGPVLLFTQRAGENVVHVTELVAGKPATAHPATCCNTPLRWQLIQVCAPDLAEPCPGCLTALRSRQRHAAHRVHSGHRS